VKRKLAVEGNGERVSYANIGQTIKGDDTWANYLNNTSIVEGNNVGMTYAQGT
jgi:hypothetical protein